MLVGSVIAVSSLVIAGVGCSHTTTESGSSSSDVTAATPVLPVISQVYAGDATGAGAYVEVFNPSQANIAVKAFVLQWAKGDADFSRTNLLPLPGDDLANAQLVPGQRLHLKLPDGQVTPAAGKVAIAYSTALAEGCVDGAPTTNSCTKDATVDYFGWGATTFVPQPGTPVAGLTTDNTAVRRGGGCQNVGDSAKDFALGPLVQHTLEDKPTACIAPDVDAGVKTNWWLLNEIKIRQGAAFTSGFVELACLENVSLATLTYVALDSAGVATSVVELGKYQCGIGTADKPSGIVLIASEGGTASQSDNATVIRVPAATAATSPTSFFLLYTPGAVPVVGTSYDPNGTGTVTWPTGVAPVDQIAVAPDAATAAKRYAKTKDGKPASVIVATADAISRPFYGDTRKPSWSDAADWFGGVLADGDDQLAYDAKLSTKNIPQDVFSLTPGASNLAPSIERGDGGSNTETDIGSTTDGGVVPASDDPPVKAKATNPASTPIADSAPSVCSMTSGPRGPGYGFLAALGAVVGLAAVRRRTRR